MQIKFKKKNQNLIDKEKIKKFIVIFSNNKRKELSTAVKTN